MAIFREHPLRQPLSQEIRARPYELLRAPVRISHLAVTSGEGGALADHAHVAALCEAFGRPAPEAGAVHHADDLGPALRLKWERHTEFSTYTFVSTDPFDADRPFDGPFAKDVPDAWVRDLPGHVLVAARLVMENTTRPERTIEELSDLFNGNTVAGSINIGGRAKTWTDFRIHDDGFNHILVRNIDMNPRQAGRMIQRLLEISTYRMMALLAFPVARAAMPKLAKIEQQLSVITSQLALGSPDETHGEDVLLDRISQLAAEVEGIIGETSYRLSATKAYYSLIARQTEDLREERIEGLQPPAEFVNRRLRPAMDTCASVEARQKALSERIGRAASLLRTRVDVELEKQNRNLLKSMDRRARLQLRLQETVEGLSVAAITYYAASLVAYIAKAAKEAGAPIPVEIVTGVSIPVIALLVWWGVRRVRKAITKKTGTDDMP